MRKFVIGLAAIAAIGLVAPTTSVLAQEKTVIIKKKEGDRGLHRGWHEGRHYGWRNHNKKVVVIKNERRHHGAAVVVKKRSPSVTTGVTIRN